MIRTGSSSVGLLLGLALLGVTATATAAPPAPPTSSRDQARAQAKAEVKRAQLAYKLARFDEALEEFSRAYELSPMPALLFNLGQCHRNLKNHERAIFFFEGYLREQRQISPDQKALTESLLAESRAELERQNTEAAATAARFAAPALTTPTTPAPGMQRAAMRDLDVRGGSQPSGAAISIEAGTAPPLNQGDDRDRPAGGTSVTHRWWFWTAIAGAIAAGAVAYYATGDPRLVPPTGSVGGLDYRH
jgi:tetratricopeptide (TPR) repeat protein